MERPASSGSTVCDVARGRSLPASWPLGWRPGEMAGEDQTSRLQWCPLEWKPGESGLAPCFFIVASTATDQPVVSGTVGDCLLLVPDGRRLDLFEVPLGGSFVPVKTDLYV